MQSSALLLSAFGSTKLEDTIASLERKEIPLPTDEIKELPLPSLPIPSAMSIDKTELPKPPTPTIANLETLEECFNILQNAFQNPTADSKKELDARLTLKTAYDHGKDLEKQFYEHAVLAGYYKDVSFEEWKPIKEKIKQEAIIGDNDTKINFIKSIIYNTTNYASPEDISLAKKLLYNLAITKYTEAQTLLGKFFFEGLNDYIPANLGEAIFWLKEASIHHHVEAHFLLGICYQQLTPLSGEMVDYTLQPGLLEATKLFTRAVEHKDTKLDLENRQIKQKARLYLETCQIERKASLGDAKSQYLLAERYEKGIGATASLPKALGWYRHALNHAHDGPEKEKSAIAWQQFIGKNDAAYKAYEATTYYSRDRMLYCKVEDLHQTAKEQKEDFTNPFLNKAGTYRIKSKFIIREKTRKLLAFQQTLPSPAKEGLEGLESLDSISMGVAQLKIR